MLCRSGMIGCQCVSISLLYVLPSVLSVSVFLADRTHYSAFLLLYGYWHVLLLHPLIILLLLLLLLSLALALARSPLLLFSSLLSLHLTYMSMYLHLSQRTYVAGRCLHFSMNSPREVPEQLPHSVNCPVNH
jgi:hypothetical protein